MGVTVVAVPVVGLFGRLVHDAGSRSCTAATENKGKRRHRQLRALRRRSDSTLAARTEPGPKRGGAYQRDHGLDRSTHV
ncbi:hypothetical protein D2E42_01625 [Mycobacteroides abscessus]|nr:hypothetical protein DDK10_02080 [Mycobacteroides abscessus]RIR79510.1 hypothetical protein D2E42_01625 [Mycobacteroides abscessus]RIU01297.1 hypothetical protein D2F00_06345 [Mycobacteroides abscessus]